jgi:FHS family L-fucose permease-like MFS transporter
MSPAQPTTSGGSKNAGPAGSLRGPFALMTVLFFMWGFMTVWNDLLIPRFKEAFALSYFQAMLVQFAFFGAYAVGALVYYVISVLRGDPINRLGYKNGVVIGLVISALGSLLFYPAALLLSYPCFLLALFVLGLGFAMLQIAANPYVTILGPEATASSRLNLSQSFNSLGTTIGPILGGWLIYTVFTRAGEHGAAAVRLPYLILACVFACLAVFFWLVRLPAFRNEAPQGGPRELLRHPHVLLGVLAIFMYVGGEVSVGSALINYLGSPRLGSLPPETASHYLAYYWGGLMVGRFMGAISLGELRPWLKRSLLVLIPLLAFLVLLAVATTHDALHAGVLLALLLAAFAVGGSSAPRMLALFSLVILCLLLLGVVGEGTLAMWPVLGIGLFCSVMWSNIFSLAIEGLGPLKSQASSLLVMAILGGAVLPPLQGALADRLGIQVSFLVPALAFAYVAFYGLRGHRLGRD